jgi:hypothetical protein
MKEYVAELIQASPSPLQSRNILREYLQYRILGVLQRSGAMVPLAFHGGTALRLLFSLPRHSEDLDFTLEAAGELYDFEAYLGAITSELTNEGYRTELKVSEGKVVNSAFIRFIGLLHELGLSGHPDEVFSAKLEVDTNPPKGAGLVTTVVRKHITLQLQHHDRASLLAGKIHAILQRGFTKGRDLFDLMWYLSDREWPEPNLELLNNALIQTGWSGSSLTAENWRDVLRNVVEDLNWREVHNDVQPFIESPDELQILTKENVISLLV